ncbi:hypothetical protein LUZ60_017021 [Juncus effusus]|nr:hypothetical protein LUZ60_017021 [Juncus effusus]
MGAKLSCENGMETSSSSSARAMVRVIAADGSLRQFSPPVSASDALINTPNSSSFFLCNSDTLYFNSYISAVLPEELLRPGHLYFILPLSMLGIALSHLEMAALAVKATSAFASSPSSSSSSKRRPGGRNIRVMPVLFQDSSNNNNEEYNQRLNEDTLMATATKRAASSSKIGKMASTPAKLGRPRLVKKRLTAIQEVEVAE